MKGPNDHDRPLESQLPPAIHATPNDVRTSPTEDIRWWTPGWEDVVQYVGWRWVLLSPLAMVLALVICAFFFGPIRGALLMMGLQVFAFAAAVAISLAGYVIRMAVRARGEPFCVFCGYNLSGLPDNYRCPECGRPYSWRLIDEYKKDPHWFRERWSLAQELPPPGVPFPAGNVPRRRRAEDGTE